MISTVTELRFRRGQAAHQMAGILDKPLTSESRARFDMLSTEEKRLKSTIESIERADSLDREAATRYHRAWADFVRNGFSQTELDHGVSAESRAVLLRGENRETRDMGTGGQAAYPGATGGFFVPAAFEDKVESALKYYGPMLEVGTPLDTTTGAPLAHPTDNDTSVIGEQINENTQVTVADVPLGQIVFNAYKYSSRMVKLSVELLQDSAFDFESYLADKFGFRIARVLNPLFTNGSGTGQPLGIIPAATIGVTAIGASNSDGGSETGANSIGADDLIDLEHSLDVAYRKGAQYMFSDTTLQAIKLLKDKSGRLVWQAGVAAGAVDTVNGYPYVINPDMASIAPNAITVAFGRLDKYAIRRAGPMWVQRLDQRFADYGQVAFIGWARRDGRLLDAGTHPVKLLQQHA